MQFLLALLPTVLLAISTNAQYFKFETFGKSKCAGPVTGTFQCVYPDCETEFGGVIPYSIEILKSEGCNLYLWSSYYSGEEGFLPYYDVYAGECVYFTEGYPIESFEVVCDY